MDKKMLFSLSFILLTILIISLSVSARDTYLLDKPKEVLLTFDDGPNPLYTPRVLSILEDNNIKSLFFVVGEEVKNNPELLKKIHNDGHMIGGHTYSHSVITKLSDEKIKWEINKSDEIINNTVGLRPKYFRPPTGAYNNRENALLKELDKKVLMWDFGLEKRAIDTAKGLVDHIISRIEDKKNNNRVLLLLHDGDPSKKYSRELTVEALPILIDRLKDKGYTFIDPLSPRGKEFIDYFSVKHPKIGVY